MVRGGERDRQPSACGSLLSRGDQRLIGPNVVYVIKESVLWVAIANPSKLVARPCQEHLPDHKAVVQVLGKCKFQRSLIVDDGNHLRPFREPKSRDIVKLDQAEGFEMAQRAKVQSGAIVPLELTVEDHGHDLVSNHP